MTQADLLGHTPKGIRKRTRSMAADPHNATRGRQQKASGLIVLTVLVVSCGTCHDTASGDGLAGIATRNSEAGRSSPRQRAASRRPACTSTGCVNRRQPRGVGIGTKVA